MLQSGKEVPVKVNGEYDVKIEAVGAKGDGIAKVQGFTLFIKDAEINSFVRVRVSKLMSTFGFADII